MSPISYIVTRKQIYSSHFEQNSPLCKYDRIVESFRKEKRVFLLLNDLMSVLIIYIIKYRINK